MGRHCGYGCAALGDGPTRPIYLSPSLHTHSRTDIRILNYHYHIPAITITNTHTLPTARVPISLLYQLTPLDSTLEAKHRQSSSPGMIQHDSLDPPPLLRGAGALVAWALTAWLPNAGWLGAMNSLGRLTGISMLQTRRLGAMS